VLFVDPSGDRYCKYDHCFKVFQRAIKHFSRSDFDGRARATPVFFTPSEALEVFKVSDIVGGLNQTPLSKLLSVNDMAKTIHGPWGAAIVFGPNLFSPLNDFDATYLHELIHAYTNLTDNQLFDLFKPFGLKNLHFGSVDITQWIMSNCNNMGGAK